MEHINSIINPDGTFGEKFEERITLLMCLVSFAPAGALLARFMGWL